MRVSLSALSILTLFALTGELVLARDAGQFDQVSPEIRKWFKSLMHPSKKFTCCTESDCKRTVGRIEGKGYFALTPDGTWVEVPDDAIVRNAGNPMGEPVLCADKLREYIGDELIANWHVYCYVPGPEM